ncbi:SDR family NAD(P)-dependent oxidoreductase [Pseudonocardia halophobica]|uniref:SDR family NAD(P)-dependent oxidoreductase n=1 Tax=Pseudonocardia halophobica TaxID=29401 RepID=UPI003D8E7A3C
MRFTGRTAVVTGAGGEIGRAVVDRLVAEGAAVLAVDRVVVPPAPGVHPHVADVTDPAAVAGYAEAGAALGGGTIDLFVNNAGIEGTVARLEDLAVEDFDRVQAVNVRGVFLGLKHVLPRMVRGGVVVNAGSVASLRGAPGVGAYIASKHAVLGLTRTAALEQADRGVRVCAVCPGPVEGRMMASLDSGRGRAGSTPGAFDGGRYATVEEVAGAVCFLLSPDAGFVSGTTLTVDGARTA